jgi:hypothetical protein
MKVKIVPTSPLDPMFRESPTRSTPQAQEEPMSRFTFKNGQPVPDEAFDGYEGPPDRPNAVLSDEYIEALDAAVEAAEKEKPATKEKPTQTTITTLEAAGDEFISQNGGGPGVRLKKAKPE